MITVQNQERERIGKRAALLAVVGNILLTIFNFTVGMLSGSTALVAEASHTLSDILTSVVAYIGFKIGMKPVDENYNYGYGRAEPLVGLVVVVFLGMVAFEILREVYFKLTLGSALTPPDLTAGIMAFAGIMVNLILTRYLMKSGKKIHSPAIMADAHHQKVDIYSCAAILMGVIGARLGFTFLDPIIALIIALLVIRTAFHLAQENISSLLGKVPSADLKKNIKAAALSVKDIQDIHKLKINSVGPYVSAELHVEVPGDFKLKDVHKIACQVEDNIVKTVEPVRMVSVRSCPLEEECGSP